MQFFDIYNGNNILLGLFLIQQFTCNIVPIGTCGQTIHSCLYNNEIKAHRQVGVELVEGRGYEPYEARRYKEPTLMSQLIYHCLVRDMAKLKINLNDTQSLRDLLEEVYKLADEQIIQAQNEINKMANATQLQEESIDGKAKYGKIINDYLGIKDKAISKKIDVAKILSDICNHNGDIKGALEGNEDTIKDMSFNFDDIKKMVDDSLQEKTKKIELNK